MIAQKGKKPRRKGEMKTNNDIQGPSSSKNVGKGKEIQIVEKRQGSRFDILMDWENYGDEMNREPIIEKETPQTMVVRDNPLSDPSIA